MVDMRVRAAFGALCVFLALVASPAMVRGQSAPDAVPASVSVPVPVRVETVAPVIAPSPPAAPVSSPLSKEVVVARRCEASTIFSRLADPDGTRVFYAEYSSDAFESMVSQGCTRIRQGCNACRIDYTGCTPDERSACRDGDCLARVCERRVLCTMKACSAYGTKAPPCESRFARHSCEATAFDALDSRALPGQ